MKKRIIATVLTVLMTAASLAGCASPADNSGGATGGAPADSAAPSDTSPEASSDTASDSDKALKLRITASLPSLSWMQNTTTKDMKVWHQMFEGLYGMDEANSGYYKELAQDVALSDDQLDYTITLVDGVKFQNGDPLKASDVVFSYKTAMENPKFNFLTSMIEDISAVDDSTVSLRLNKPYAPIDHTFYCIKIINEREYTEQGDKFGTIPHKAGTGPYYVTEYNIATDVKLTAFEDYWRGVPEIKNIVYYVISDEVAAVIAYQNGELDYLEDAPLSDWESLAGIAGPDNSVILKGNNIQIFTVNNLSPYNNNVLGNQKVREAIFYAINKEDINMGVYDGYGAAATQYMPDEYVPTSPKDGFQTYDFDPEKAKQLLTEAGYPDGVDIGTLITYNANNGKLAQVVQANLARVGIKAEVSIAENAVQTPKMYAQEYELAVFQDSGNYDFNNIRQQVHSESVGMYLVDYKTGDHFDWKRIEELVDLGASTSDVGERVKHYTELWSMIMDTATILPAIHRPIAIVWAKDLDISDPVPTYYKVRQFSWK